MTIFKWTIQRMRNALNKTLPHAANTVLDAPVTMEELHLAVRSGKPHKAPGGDGICQEFFQINMANDETRHVGNSESNALTPTGQYWNNINTGY